MDTESLAGGLLRLNTLKYTHKIDDDDATRDPKKS